MMACVDDPAKYKYVCHHMANSSSLGQSKVGKVTYMEEGLELRSTTAPNQNQSPTYILEVQIT